MKKSYPFDKLSEKTCKKLGCDKKLKLRLVEEKPAAELCYLHYKEKEARRNHYIDQNPRKSRLEANLPVKYL